ncbi:MAG TPA: hypothetical protein VKG44_08500, partial [Candidatus Baltobacteraceae bacterium]|nr:hypothetical protein [Candidatus Baltobacteraceae bacterium]
AGHVFLGLAQATSQLLGAQAFHLSTTMGAILVLDLAVAGIAVVTYGVLHQRRLAPQPSNVERG